MSKKSILSKKNTVSNCGSDLFRSRQICQTNVPSYYAITLPYIGYALFVIISNFLVHGLFFNEDWPYDDILPYDSKFLGLQQFTEKNLKCALIISANNEFITQLALYTLAIRQSLIVYTGERFNDTDDLERNVPIVHLYQYNNDRSVCSKSKSKTRVSNLRPAGQMRAAKGFNQARREILKIC